MIVNCATCQAYVEAEEIGHHQYGPTEGAPPGRHVFLVCSRCRNPMLIVQDNIGNMAAGDIWATPIRVYPEPMRVNMNAPVAIRNSMNEAYACFHARAYTAAAIMCRKTLEGVCKEHGADGNTLMKMLRSMRDVGTIDSQLYEWSNALRHAGNEAAHDVGVEFSVTDASDALEFTNAIVDYLFSYRDRFLKFKERRAGIN